MKCAYRENYTGILFCRIYPYLSNKAKFTQYMILLHGYLVVFSGCINWYDSVGSINCLNIR